MANTTAIDNGTYAEYIVVAIVSTFGVLLNSASLVVLFSHFTRIFGNIEACFVANLAFADLLTSLGGLIWGISGSIKFTPTEKNTLLITLWITVAASFLTLMFMGFERLFVVISPLKTQRYFKKPLAYACCAVIWFIAIITGSMITVNTSIALFVMTVMFEVSLVTTLVCYAFIYLTIKRLRKDTAATARYDANNATLNLEGEPENETAIHHRVTVRQESRVTNMIFVLVVVLAVTVLPYMILLQVNVGYLLFCYDCEVRSTLLKLLDYMFPIEMLNFMLNPAIYAWRLPKFRHAAKRTFGRFICCKSLREKLNTLAVNSHSSDSGSLGNGPATIFTGRETQAPLNNNRRS